jgi:hypothetical protein
MTPMVRAVLNGRQTKTMHATAVIAFIQETNSRA